MAADRGRGDVIRKLLQAGADLYVRSKVGHGSTRLSVIPCSMVHYMTFQDNKTAIDFATATSTKQMMLKFGSLATV
jgi:hypothetical protein